MLFSISQDFPLYGVFKSAPPTLSDFYFKIRLDVAVVSVCANTDVP